MTDEKKLSFMNEFEELIDEIEFDDIRDQNLEVDIKKLCLLLAKYNLCGGGDS